MSITLLRIVHAFNTCLNFLLPLRQRRQPYLQVTPQMSGRLTTSSTRLTGDYTNPEDRYNILPFRGDYKRLLIHDLKTNLKWVEQFDCEIDAGNYCLTLYSSEYYEGSLPRLEAPSQLIRTSYQTSGIPEIY